MSRPVNPGAGLAGLLFMVACALALLPSATTAQTDSTGINRRFLDALAKVPEHARAMHSPVESDPGALAAGGKLFEQHCAECHGKKAEGTRRAPSLLGRAVQQAPPGAIFWVLTNGVVRHGMPVWSKLPEPMRWQLVTFLKSLNLRTPEREGNP